MAKKRVVRSYSNTRAKGEVSKIEGDRYFLRVDLVSAKLEESSDLLSRNSQIYFKCDRKRVPNKGEIHLEINEVFKPTGGISLYTQFIKKKGGGTEEVKFQVFEHDKLKDDELVDEKIAVVMGQKKEYLSFSKEGIKIKIAISAKKTRY